MTIDNETVENLKAGLETPELEARYRDSLRKLGQLATRIAPVKTPLRGRFFADPLLGIYYKEPGDYLDRGERKIPLHDCPYPLTVEFFQGGSLGALALQGAARASQLRTLTEMADDFLSKALS